MGLKRRIVPILLWDGRGCVKGQRFDPGRCIGSMIDRVRVLERRDVDELVILDIAATPEGRGPRFAEVAELAGNLFCPLTVGGGVTTIEDIRLLLACGADKVVIGSAAQNTEFVRAASSKFGAQAIVAAVDVNAGTVWVDCGGRDTGVRPKWWAYTLERCGAGEILLTAIDRDGTMQGYDLPLIRSVVDAVSIPVVAAGGCGSYADMAAVMDVGATPAVGAAFQFREMTPKGAARYLAERGYAVRV